MSTLTVPDIAAGRYDHLTPEEFATIVRLQVREEHRLRREANVRGFIICLALVLQGVVDVHMWGHV